MKGFIDHIGHLLWSLGLLYKHALLLDLKECMEIYYWTKIHMTYAGQRIGKPVFKWSTFWVQIHGLIGSIIIIEIIYYLFLRFFW